MQSAGASPENIERELAKLPADDPEDMLEIGVEDEGPAIILFLGLATQWKTAGMAGFKTGLDYGAVKGTAANLGVAMSPPVFCDLQLMEAEALKVQAERMAAR